MLLLNATTCSLIYFKFYGYMCVPLFNIPLYFIFELLTILIEAPSAFILASPLVKITTISVIITLGKIVPSIPFCKTMHTSSLLNNEPTPFYFYFTKRDRPGRHVLHHSNNGPRINHEENLLLY